MYLFTYNTCSKQYTRSTEDFRTRFNNYRCVNRNFFIVIIIIIYLLVSWVRGPIRQEGNPFDRYILNVSQDVAGWRGVYMYSGGSKAPIRFSGRGRPCLTLLLNLRCFSYVLCRWRSSSLSEDALTKLLKIGCFS